MPKEQKGHLLVLQCMLNITPVFIIKLLNYLIAASSTDNRIVVYLSLAVHAVSFSASLVFARDCCCIPCIHPRLAINRTYKHTGPYITKLKENVLKQCKDELENRQGFFLQPTEQPSIWGD
jgi:hypothetical protein